MLHLFNKVYLHSDDNLDIQQNRAVISKKNGFIISGDLSMATSGTLLHFSESLEEKDLSDILLSLKQKNQETNAKSIIYADEENFVKISAIWFKSITNFTKEEFVFWLKSYIHKEKINLKGFGRITNPNSEEIYLNKLMNYVDVWDEISAVNLNLSDVDYSYELYLSSYMYNKNSSEKLKKLLSLFMRRSYIEIFLDIKCMILSFILDQKLQKFLGGSNKNLDNYQELPKINIFLNETIWNHLTFKWENLTKELLDELSKTITDIHNNYQNFVYDSSNLTKWNFCYYLLNRDLSDVELSEVVEHLLGDPGDLNFLPKSDYENVNPILCSHIMNLKNSNETEKLFNYTLK